MTPEEKTKIVQLSKEYEKDLIDYPINSSFEFGFYVGYMEAVKDNKKD